jgi:hypothetical protein
MCPLSQETDTTQEIDMTFRKNEDFITNDEHLALFPQLT